jgi:DNA ligase-1
LRGLILATLLHAVASTSAEVSKTGSRNQKTVLLADLLRSLHPTELEIAVGLLVGQPRQRRLGVGYVSIFGVEVEPAKAPSLTLSEVDQTLAALQGTAGSGSQRTRNELLRSLMERATRTEQSFLRQVLTGEVRQGALGGVMTEAVARAFEVPPNVVRRASMLRGDLGQVAEIARANGIEGLKSIGLQVLTPIQPMLASPGAAIPETLDGPTSIEWKLDGARIQVHRLDETVAVFTRNLNDVTERMPEVRETALSLSAHSFVLDGEAMALRDDGTPQPFQETMSRFGTEERAFAEVPVLPFFFDLLHLDGVDLIDVPLVERQQLLDRIAPPERLIPRVLTASAEEAEAFSRSALEAGHEGVMIKVPESRYEAGRRGKSWLKVKPVHTYDLVVLAAEWGHGRRSGYLSNIHLGARDETTGEFVMVGKTFKGMTDEMLSWQTEYFPTLEKNRDEWAVYLRPEQVVEIALDGVQASTRYPGGVALRFARVKRYRFDKTAAQADTIRTLRALLPRQPSSSSSA